MNSKIMPFDKDYPQLGIAQLCEWFESEQEEEEESVTKVIKMIEDGTKMGRPLTELDLEIGLLKKED